MRDACASLAGGLDVHVTDGAVTDADVWLYDRRTARRRVRRSGDVSGAVFETCVPATRGGAALDEVWATPFRIAIPGHGAPMNRAQFDAYRGAFNAFVDCVSSEAEAPQCAALGLNARGSSSTTDEERAEAVEYAEYYVGFLRAHNGGRPDLPSRIRSRAPRAAARSLMCAS